MRFAFTMMTALVSCIPLGMSRKKVFFSFNEAEILNKALIAGSLCS